MSQMSSIGQRVEKYGVEFDVASLLAEELRTSVVQARHALQLARLECDMGLVATAEQCLSQSILLLERYLESNVLLRSQTALQFETLSIGAVMEEVAHRSTPLAALYGTRIEVDYRAAKKPISGHRESLVNILEHLATVFLQCSPKEIVLSTSATRIGLRAGVFAEDAPASQLYKQVQNMIEGRSLVATQPGLAHLLVAHRIGQSQGIPMSAGKRLSLRGLSMTIPWSQQLNLLEHGQLS